MGDGEKRGGNMKYHKGQNLDYLPFKSFCMRDVTYSEKLLYPASVAFALACLWSISSMYMFALFGLVCFGDIQNYNILLTSVVNHTIMIIL